MGVDYSRQMSTFAVKLRKEKENEDIAIPTDTEADSLGRRPNSTVQAAQLYHSEHRRELGIVGRCRRRDSMPDDGEQAAQHLGGRVQGATRGKSQL